MIALVVLVSLGLFATVILVVASNDVTTLSRQQRDDLGRAVASSLSVSYRQSGSWAGADRSAALTLATHAGIAVEVRDVSGALVASASPTGVGPAALGAAFELPVVADGSKVGTVSVRSSSTGIGATGGALRRALAAATGWSAAVLALLAVAAGVIVARRITRPVVTITGVAQAMASGQRGARVGDVHAPGELAELSRAFDHMADTLEREDQLRRGLVADIAHELRTPLAILLASTEAMADGITAPDAPALSSLHDEALRLGRIVEDLEVLASAEAAGLTLERKPVDLAVVASHAADALRPRLESGALTLERSLLPVVVLGDKTRLHQMMSNLLTNAIKFTSAGGTITLTVAPDVDVARITVEDTGIGIPQEDLPHVFERFWRGRAAHRVAGSGIGLAVVEELVHAHGGNVTVMSEEGHGSRFVVTLPRA